MKKTNYKIIKSLFTLMLFAALFGFLAASASAQTAQSKPFFSGYNLAVTATSTNTFNATNTYAKGFYVTNSGTYPYTSSIVALTVTNTAGIADVQLWADRDGSSPAANISVQLAGLNAAFTNTGLFKFATVPAVSDSPEYQAVSFLPATVNGSFSVAITGNGTTHVVVATNLPTSVLQGARKLRLTSVEWTNAGTNGTVVGVWLNGYKPD